MKTIISKVLLGAMFASASMAAHAVCTDPPRQFVDWAGCTKTGVDAGKSAVLFGANLVQGNFSGLYLGRAQLAYVNALGANFSNVDFSEANLTNANLFKANVTGAIWKDANLAGARWVDGTICEGTILGQCHVNQLLKQF